ncbi:hypothetical protein FRC07_005364 [Ceratobasidium sp. 392]|nr:hypothetical protein FRC07_005364 [Ceratobasidium sp. 392]
MRPKKTIVLAGWFIPREELDKWSEREEKVNEVYRRCLKQEAGFVTLAVYAYLRKHQLEKSIKYHFTPMPKHGNCGRHCWNCNIVYYRRYGEVSSMAKCKPGHWKRFEPKPADLEVKKQIEDVLNLQLSEWTTIVWGPTAMVYDATCEMFEARGAELIEELENSPPGPCGPDPPPLT